MLTYLLLTLAAQNPAPQSPATGTVIVKGDTKLTLGAELRFRSETRDPSPPIEGAGSNTGSNGRFRISLDAALNARVRGFVQLQESILVDGTASSDTLHQAFGEVKGIGELVDVQVGRFEMIYGDELLVGNGDWGPTGKSFDGLRLHHMTDTFWVDAFVSQPVEGQAVLVGVDETFAGVYGGLPGDGWSGEAYVLSRNSRADGGMGTGDLTAGARFTLALDNGLAFKAEAAQQSGDHGALDAGGTMFMADAGTPLGDAFNVGVNILYASGDDDGADGDDDAFRTLYNSPHKILGSQDLFALTNILDAQVYAGYKVSGTWKLTGAVHMLQLAEENGILPVLPAGTGMVGAVGESDLGIELDVAIRGTVVEDVDLWFGVSQFMAGDAVANGDDQLWAFAQLLLRI